VKPTADPLTALTQAYALLFVLILPVPLKRMRLGRMKMGTLQRSIKTMLFAPVLWSSFLHLEPSLRYVEGCGKRFCPPQRRGFYRLGHRHPAQEEIVVV
jgi:hypothetical protein